MRMLRIGSMTSADTSSVGATIKLDIVSDLESVDIMMCCLRIFFREQK